MSVPQFLKALQLHIFEYGMPASCFSDLGTQIVAGGNIVENLVQTPDAQSYLNEFGIKSVKFEQYFKGNHELGGLVESCVKMVKRLIHGSIKNTILPYDDFDFFVQQTIHLVNKRPVAFKEVLRDDLSFDSPDPITPEILIRGHELPSINVIPSLNTEPDDWVPNPTVENLRNHYSKLKKVRENLFELYQGEFLATLVSQATDRQGRYKKQAHKVLKIGDIVLLKEDLTKPAKYPMAVVKDVKINDLGEVTGVVVLKGGTREMVKRHSTAVIPLLSICDEHVSSKNTQTGLELQNPAEEGRLRRLAAVESEQKTKKLFKGDLA